MNKLKALSDLPYNETFLQIQFEKTSKGYLVLCDDVGKEIARRIIMSRDALSRTYLEYHINFICKYSKNNKDHFLTVINEFGNAWIEDFEILEEAESYMTDYLNDMYAKVGRIDLEVPKTFLEAINTKIIKVVR